jgi:murein DD-endopeptidase MepM/ murein hydrolase activator NlpD
MQPLHLFGTMAPVVSVLFSYAKRCEAPFLRGGCVLACCGVFFYTVLWTQPAAAQQAVPGAVPTVTLSASTVEAGDPLLVQVDCRRMPAAVGEPVVSFGDQAIPLFPHPAEGKRFYVGVAGIGLAVRPGLAEVHVAWSEGAQRRSTSAAFTIRPGAYGEESLKVDPRHVRPSPYELERIRREQAELNRIYASGSRSRLWQGGFRIPVPGEMNGPFGTRRVFNGELQSQHSGVDFRAQAGDPVHAAGSGVVRLAKDLFYSGNAVIVDHGAGVFTSYSHLSRMEVGVGQRVAKGMVVGLAGATGRATGPHLHWGVKVNTVSVNPLTFIRVADLLNGR